MTAPTYSVVARDPNSWDAKTGIHIMLRDCGHNHKTIAAAEACERKLVHATCSHGTPAGRLCRHCRGRAHGGQWSANWLHAHIEDNKGNRIES